MEDLLGYTNYNRRRINNIINEVNELEREISSYSDAKLSSMTDEFRKELRNGKSIEDITPRALAVCREAIKRKLGMRPYDTQIMAAASMNDNIIAEMKTGEGKTLVQILSSYLHVLESTKDLDKSKWGSVHILTANEYLASRDQEQNKPVFNLLGLSCGYVEEQSKYDTSGYRERKVSSYKSDIVYATAKTVAFDYLDDNQVKEFNKRYITRRMDHAIIDEADDILFDQANTPLILSGTMPGITMKNKINLARWAASYVNGANGVRNKPLTCKIYSQYRQNCEEIYDEDTKKVDCILFLDNMNVILSKNIYDEIYGSYDLRQNGVQEELFNRERAITNAILAKYYFKRNKQYALVETNNKNEYEIQLISDTTGRLMTNTKYRNGYQEALEAQEEYLSNGKYSIKMTETSVERGKITYPEFVSLYKTGVCGMTGTSDVEEFKNIYNLETYFVPTLKEEHRNDIGSKLYPTLSLKYDAIVNDALTHHKKGQPVLIGTTSISESDAICKYFDSMGIRYQRLDAINDKDEAMKIKNAGRKGMITIASKMAGRGTDIAIDDEVNTLGGLYIIGTSKNKSKRIDRQLMGRCARHGQNGSTIFYQSLEDELVTNRHRKNNFIGIRTLLAAKGEEIKNKKLIELVDNCQKVEEEKAKESRKLEKKLEVEVYRVHREKFYEQRNKLLEANPKEFIMLINDIIKEYSIYVCDSNELSKISHLVDIDSCSDSNDIAFKNNIIKTLLYRFQKSKGNVEMYKYIEYVRSRVLDVLDSFWISHLLNLEDMRKSIIHSGVVVSEDSTEKFKREADLMFNGMNRYIQNEIITYATTPTLAIGSYNVIDSIEEENKYEIDY